MKKEREIEWEIEAKINGTKRFSFNNNSPLSFAAKSPSVQTQTHLRSYTTTKNRNN